MIDVQKANVDFSTVFKNILGNEKLDIQQGDNKGESNVMDALFRISKDEKWIENDISIKLSISIEYGSLIVIVFEKILGLLVINALLFSKIYYNYLSFPIFLQSFFKVIIELP